MLTCRIKSHKCPRFLHTRVGFIGLLAIGLFATIALGQDLSVKPFSPLSPEDEHLASHLVRSDLKIIHLLGQGRFRICYVELVTPKPSTDNADLSRRARVVLYNPEKSTGASAIVELSAKRVSEQQVLPWESVPLAPDDVAEARQILEGDDRMRDVLNRDRQKYQTDIVLVKSSDESDACHKDRCLSASFWRRDSDHTAGLTAIVDLNTKAVSISHYQ